MSFRSIKQLSKTKRDLLGNGKDKLLKMKQDLQLEERKEDRAVTSSSSSHQKSKKSTLFGVGSNMNNQLSDYRRSTFDYDRWVDLKPSDIVKEEEVKRDMPEALSLGQSNLYAVSVISAGNASALLTNRGHCFMIPEK